MAHLQMFFYDGKRGHSLSKNGVHIHLYCKNITMLGIRLRSVLFPPPKKGSLHKDLKLVMFPIPVCSVGENTAKLKTI